MDAAAPEEPSSPVQATRQCKKPWCRNLIPMNFRYQNCDKCRQQNNKSQKAKRAVAKASAAAQATDSIVDGSRKRKRTSVDSPDGRPTTRPRTTDEGDRAHSPHDIDSDTESGDAPASDGPGNVNDSEMKAEAFSDVESFFDALRKEFKSGKAVEFHGVYTAPVDPLVSSKERVQMVAREIWKISGYRFTVKDHRELKSGHRTRFWCSQDEARKKKSKASTNPDIRNRDNVGMKRYPCKSKLAISCRTAKDDDSRLRVTVQLEHAEKHVCYVDVSMPPGALDIIRESVEWLTPVAMVGKVQAAYPNVSAAQVHRAWTEMSEIFWRRDDAQLPSTEKLLAEFGDDVDVFKPEDVPEGVEMVCWGMKKIAEALKGKIVEIGVDATYNTNGKNLELYSIMGEHDNAGFPLSYCLLSTTSSIDQGKRTKALTAWAKCLRDTYGIIARFAHVDKDMAEIGMLKGVWNPKISLCWWHLRRAVRTRLAKAKLATTPYDPGPAHAEFSFIDPAFVPQGQVDMEDYEGGVPDTVTPVVPITPQSQTRTLPNGLRITIPARQPLAAAGEHTTQPVASEIEVDDVDPGGAVGTGKDPAIKTARKSAKIVTKAQGKENDVPATNGVQTRCGRVTRPTQKSNDAADSDTLAAAMKARVTGTAAAKRGTARTKKRKGKGGTTSDDSDIEDVEEEEEEEETTSRRTFCPARFRDPIIDMMEKHFCAHPLLPGYAHPSPEGIRRWAVLQMYKFCVKHGLQEVWAYLWGNWYKKSRWELWARSVHPEIPVLKTTMILESHWRRIKQDFLHHFHMPRCDLLAWILIVKLAPTYYRKLNRLLNDTGRYRLLPCWRKAFKRVWRKHEKASITQPVNPAYKTDAKKMICTCPSLPTSRFLICKHTVQGVKPVPPVFFLEVKRRRSPPFWVHPSLQPLVDDEASEQPCEPSPADIEVDVPDIPPDSDDEDDDLVDTMPNDDSNRQTFLEAMDDNIETILEFSKGLKYQKQFRDQRMLQALEREGASFLRLAKACLGKEKRLRSTRGAAPLTWASTGGAMFYRARPPRSDENT
ncbi:hypothetical protein C8R44DRAFT_141341 [Mycena epipterygia]|nr:hypothetical protein C8R44DRAFT_141341 [Mycena epipterygia]